MAREPRRLPSFPFASLDDTEATRYSFDRARGPWCNHHFRRHRLSSSHQLTGRRALLAMTFGTVIDEEDGVFGATKARPPPPADPSPYAGARRRLPTMAREATSMCEIRAHYRAASHSHQLDADAA